MDFPEDGKSLTVGNPEGNALSTDNINALSTNNINSLNKIYYPHPIKFQNIYEKLIKEFLQKRASITGGKDMKSIWDIDKQFPKGSVLKNSVQEIDRLVRIDGFDFRKDITLAIRWALKDSFWIDNLRSLAGLRNKSKSNGLTKFENIMNGFLRETGKYKKPEKDNSNHNSYPALSNLITETLQIESTKEFIQNVSDIVEFNKSLYRENTTQHKKYMLDELSTDRASIINRKLPLKKPEVMIKSYLRFLSFQDWIKEYTHTLFRVKGKVFQMWIEDKSNDIGVHMITGELL